MSGEIGPASVTAKESRVCTSCACIRGSVCLQDFISTPENKILKENLPGN